MNKHLMHADSTVHFGVVVTGYSHAKKTLYMPYAAVRLLIHTIQQEYPLLGIYYLDFDIIKEKKQRSERYFKKKILRAYSSKPLNTDIL